MPLGERLVATPFEATGVFEVLDVPTGFEGVLVWYLAKLVELAEGDLGGVFGGRGGGLSPVAAKDDEFPEEVRLEDLILSELGRDRLFGNGGLLGELRVCALALERVCL